MKQLNGRPKKKVGRQSRPIFNSDLSRCVRLLCLQGENEQLQNGRGESRTRGGTDGERERERETLVKLARYNRKRSNLLLITAWPLLHHPSRQRGGQQQQSQVLPPLPSDNSSTRTRNTIIYHFEVTPLSSHTHKHKLRFYSSQLIRNALTLQVNTLQSCKQHISVQLHWL